MVMLAGHADQWTPAMVSLWLYPLSIPVWAINILTLYAYDLPNPFTLPFGCIVG